jgi:hypothetical protein
VTFGTGLAGVGLEVVGVQVLAQNLENTVYTFANILAVYLVGTALGAAIYQRHAARALAGRPGGVTLALLASARRARRRRRVRAAGLAGAARRARPRAHGPDLAGVLGELGVAALVFLAPTIVMGALFAHVTGLIAAAGRGVGRGYALNTLGGALAPFIFGLWAVPRLGYADALYLVLYAYLAVFALFGWYRRFHPALLVGGVLALVALTAAAPRSLALAGPDPGWTTVVQRETLHGLVVVSERPDPERTGPDGKPLTLRRLRVGRSFRMGGALSFGEQRMGHLCAMIAEASATEPVRKAMFLGLGTGATMGAALQLADHAEADGVELVPAVLEQLSRFADINHALHAEPRAHLHAADARRFAVASPDTHDLVLADLFHPGQDGAGSLFAGRALHGGARPPAPRAPRSASGCRCISSDPRSCAPSSAPSSACSPRPTRSSASTTPRRRRSRSSAASRPPTRRAAPRPRPPAGAVHPPAPGARSSTPATCSRRTWPMGQLWPRGPARARPTPTSARAMLFDAPAVAYADDPELGAHNLAEPARAAPRRPGRLAHGARRAELREPARRYAAAALLYLRAELARGAVTDLKQLPPESAERTIEAYEAEPEFAPARGNLYAIVRRTPRSPSRSSRACWPARPTSRASTRPARATCRRSATSPASSARSRPRTPASPT